MSFFKLGIFYTTFLQKNFSILNNILFQFLIYKCLEVLYLNEIIRKACRKLIAWKTKIVCLYSDGKFAGNKRMNWKFWVLFVVAIYLIAVLRLDVLSTLIALVGLAIGLFVITSVFVLVVIILIISAILSIPYLALGCHGIVIKNGETFCTKGDGAVIKVNNVNTFFGVMAKSAPSLI